MDNERYDSATLTLRTLLAYTLARGFLLLSLVAPPTSVGAAQFDEEVSAPRELSSAELKGKARDYFADFENGLVTMLDVTRDRARHAKLTDLWWHLSRTIDQRESLDELADYGIARMADGSYSVDLKRFPQWDSLDQRMKTLLDLGSLDETMPALKQRGFRDSDIGALREYLKHHNPDLAVIAESAPLTESFALSVKERAAGGQRLSFAEMMAYSYQTARSVNEVYRTWALGVLDSLDHQRQRVLVSYLMEAKRRVSISGGDPEATQASLRYLEGFLLSGEYVRATEDQIRAIQAQQEKAERQ